MKTRILLAALALGAAAFSPSEPTAPELTPGETRARHNGYIGSGNRSDSDSTRVTDGGYIGSGNLTEPVDEGDGDGGYIGSGN